MAHTPPVRALVCRAVVNAARDRAGIALTIAHLDYNVFTLHVGADGVEVAAADRPVAPFLRVQRVDLSFRASALLGRLRFASIRLTRPMLTIENHAGGGNNLPSAPADRSPAAPSPHVEIGRLAIDRLAFKTAGGQAVSCDVRDLSLDLQPTSNGQLHGRIAASHAGTIAVGDARFDVRLAGTLTFDGTAVTLGAVDLATDGATLRLDGRVGIGDTEPQLDLIARSTVALGRVAAIWPSLAPARGVLSTSARVTGSLARPVAAFQASSPTSTVASIPFGAFAASGRVDASGASIESATVTVAGGRMTATAMVPAEGEMSARARMRGLDTIALQKALGARLPITPAAIVDATVDARWDKRGIRGLRVSAEVTATSVGNAGDRLPVGGRASFTLAEGRWALDGHHTVGRGARLDAALRGVVGDTLGTATVGGSVRLAAAADGLRYWLARVPAVASRLPGFGADADANLEVAGSLRKPRASGTVALHGLHVDGRGDGEAFARLAIDSDHAVLKDVRVSLGPSAFEGAGAVTFRHPRFSGTFATTIANLASWLPEVDPRWLPSGIVRLRGSADGPADALTVAASLSGVGIEWRGFDAGAIDGDVRLDRGALSATVRAPALNATFRGSMVLAGPHAYDASCELENSDAASLAAIAAAFGAPKWRVTGAVRLTAHASGVLGAAPRTFDSTVTAFEATIEDHPVRLAAPTRVTWSDGQLSVGSARVDADGVVLTADGHLSQGEPDTALRIGVDGQADNWAAPIVRVLGDGVSSVGGRVSGAVTVSGALDRPAVTGRLQLVNGEIRLATGQRVEAIGLELTTKDGVVEVTELRASWAGVRARASGRIPLAVFGDWVPSAIVPASTRGQRMLVRGELASISSGALVPVIGQAAADEWKGEISAAYEIETDALSLDALKASAVISQSETTIAGLPLAHQQPLRLHLERGRVTIDNAAWQIGDRTVAVTGHADLQPELRFDLAVRGSVDLSVLKLFVPVAAGGVADADVRVSGAISTPSLSGRIAVDKGWLRIAKPKIAVSTVTGTLTFAGDNVVVTANGFANGGTVQLDGVVPLRGGRESQHLHLVGKDLALNWPDGLRSTINTELTYRTSGNAGALSGRVEAMPAPYRRAAMPNFGDGTTGRSGLRSSTPFDATALDLTIVTPSGAVVDNSYARIEVDATLHVGGTVGRPSVTGRLRAQEDGQVIVRGNVFRIERGILEFDPRRGAAPSLQMAARTRRAGYEIRLLATGAIDAPVFNLTSDPPLSQTDLVALVTTGSTSNSMSPGSSTGASNAAVAAISSDVLGLAGRSLGLDTVRVGQLDLDLLGDDVDPQNRLTIGKSIRGNVDLLLSQNLSDQGLTWAVSVRPFGKVEIRYVSRDAQSQSIELRHELVFGYQAAAQRTRGEVPVPAAPKIRSITASGADLSAAQILADTKLRRGDTFDFFAWQRDREAIQQMLRDRGYLEAQVVARRESVEASRDVQLQYQVRPGPKTRLEVNGFALSPDVRNELQVIWAEAVDDRFRLSDMQEQARRAMVDSGYLWAETAAEVAAPAAGGNEKTITLAITPGARVSKRNLAFDGQAAYTADRLRGEIARRGLLDAVWRDPTAAIAALEELYRSGGYLQASIAASPIVHDGDAGRLPFHVVEGPRFDVTDLSIGGVDPPTRAMVSRWIGFKIGAPYNPAALAVAERRIEAGLKSEGYANAEAAVTSTMDTTRHTVTIVARIQAGPRGIVREVTATGNTVTRDGVVQRAMKLPPGTVAKPATLDAAQRRLYETDAFRGVVIDLEPLPADEGVSEQPLRAKVALQEAPLYRLRYGFQVTDELISATQVWDTQPGVTAELRRRNLFGSGFGVTGGFRVDPRSTSLRGALNIPSSVLWPATSTLFFKWSSEPAAEQEGLNVVETSVTYQDRWRLGRRIEWSYGYSLTASHVSLNSPQPSARSLDEGTQVGTRAELYTSLVSDTRDSAFNATRGFFSSSAFEYGAPELGSDFNYARVVLQHSRYRALGPLVLAAGATFGALFDVTGNDVLTYPIRFRAGGDRSVRGYATESLYPEGQSQALAGGNALLVVSGEARFPIWRWFKGAGFIDAGNAFTDAAHIAFSDVKIGTGFGLRLDTPYALFRFDLGFPVSQPPGARSPRFYFSIGQAF